MTLLVREPMLGLELILIMMIAVRPALAQAPREGRLLITVVDQSNAVLPGATVTAIGAEDATAKITLAPVKTQTNGIAMIPAVPPGRYNIKAEFPGFDSSFSLGINGQSAFESPALNIARPSGVQTEALSIRMPRQTMNPRATFDWAVTRDQTLRLSYTEGNLTNRNQGIGGYNEIERGFTFKNHFHTFRVQEAGPVGRRFFPNTRLNVGWTDTESRSTTEARTVRVLDSSIAT